jgi:hypothetical protein
MLQDPHNFLAIVASDPLGGHNFLAIVAIMRIVTIKGDGRDD